MGKGVVIKVRGDYVADINPTNFCPTVFVDSVNQARHYDKGSEQLKKDYLSLREQDMKPEIVDRV